MKITLTLPAVAALLLAAALAEDKPAAQSDYTFTIGKKKLSEATKLDGAFSVTVEDAAYVITVINRGRNDAENLELKYRMFVEREPDLGTTAKGTKMETADGSKEISLKRGQKETITTDTVKLEDGRLRSGWSYKGGGHQRSTDKLAGIWLRLYKDGQLQAEIAQPQTISSKQTW